MPLSDYQFNWYLRGPYSPAYTSTLYDIDKHFSELHEQENNYSLNEFSQNMLSPLKELVNYKPLDLSLPIWFELLASIHYLAKDSKLSQEELFYRLKKYKPQFSQKSQFDYAFYHLKKSKML
ncbi:hypothetical protein D3C75_1029850 [compost metagenome]